MLQKTFFETHFSIFDYYYFFKVFSLTYDLYNGIHYLINIKAKTDGGPFASLTSQPMTNQKAIIMIHPANSLVYD